MSQQPFFFFFYKFFCFCVPFFLPQGKKNKEIKKKNAMKAERLQNNAIEIQLHRKRRTHAGKKNKPKERMEWYA
ncbi:hypothetical protein [Devosia indica]